jgi:hypothetical protein
VKRFGRMLPVVLFALLGAYLWRGGFGLLPVERTITWRLWGDFASIRRVDVQLYQGDELLEHVQLETQRGATFEPTTRLALRKGTYRGLVMIWRDTGGAPEVHDEKLMVDEDSPALTVP